MERGGGGGLRGTILIKRRALRRERGGLGAVGERGGWGGGGCVRCERCGEDSGFPKAGAAVVGGDGDFMVGAAMGTRFVLAFKASDDVFERRNAFVSRCRALSLIKAYMGKV
ncbi:hypothetical protein Syun_020626 [Stephania yunnanensis]|uniref:Uncharacterized protein n=1 Tax=Stephania yunnanensis TaxID=152371 RepID=A0AAP0NPV1_9MAGN